MCCYKMLQPNRFYWIYSTVIKKTFPGTVLGSIFSKSVENFEKHQK